MKNRYKWILLTALCLISLGLAVGIGSVFVPFSDIAKILGHKLFGIGLDERLIGTALSIVWTIRLPRALCAFLVGAALAESGTVMQSVLNNPLASSYTLGVSSGASLGAAIVIITGISLPVAGLFTLPLAGFVFGLVTVILVIGFSSRIDHGLMNQTVILAGMVFSLFVNAILTLISALAQNYMQQLLLWQMGSFSSKRWEHVGILLAVTVLGTVILLAYTREMDMMTFGEESARAMGVDTRRVKMKLLVTASFLTGTAVCFTGTIGFIDLIAPHVVRRVFGHSHRYLLPISALFGGIFMVFADLAARTVLAPVELPVGAVTALLGAPFFAWIYFTKSAPGTRRG